MDGTVEFLKRSVLVSVILYLPLVLSFSVSMLSLRGNNSLVCSSLRPHVTVYNLDGPLVLFVTLCSLLQWVVQVIVYLFLTDCWMKDIPQAE